MITEKDIKVLEKTTSRGTVLTIKYMMPAIALFFLVAAVVNLRTASILANASQMNLRELFISWTHGFDLKLSYTGIYCLGIEKLSTSMLNFGMIFFFISIWIWKMKDIERSRRILTHLQATQCEPVGMRRRSE